MDIDQRIVSTIYVARFGRKDVGRSVYVEATATKDIDLALCIVPRRACILTAQQLTRPHATHIQAGRTHPAIAYFSNTRTHTHTHTHTHPP